MNLRSNFLLSGICLLAISPVFADVPNTTPPNLITNGNFEQMKDGQPVGWAETPPQTDLITVNFPNEKEHGNIAQINLLRSGDKGAYFSQSVKVEPHSHYHLSLLARMSEGKITFAVGGGKGENALNVRLIGQVRTRLPMTPLFWNEAWLKYLVFDANQWRPVSLEFDSGELTQVSIAFGAYFTAGSYSFDDVSLVKTSDIPTPSK